jgi:hypothetical protein
VTVSAWACCKIVRAYTGCLQAIATGWPHWLKTVVHDIGKAAEYVAPYVPFAVIGTIFGVAATNAQTHYTSLGGYPL